jgi:hypothetical protein
MDRRKWVFLIIILCFLLMCMGCTSQNEKSAPVANIKSVAVTPVQNETAASTSQAVSVVQTKPQDSGSSSKDYLEVNKFYTPSGYMGDTAAINIMQNSKYMCHTQPDCMRCSYNPTLSSEQGWAGVYWLSPYDNWGDKENGIDLSKYSRLSFYARGETGKEKVIFCVGGINGTLYHDSIAQPLCTSETPLTTEWVQYDIDLSKQNLSNIIGGFTWITSTQGNPKGCTFYLDDITYH